MGKSPRFFIIFALFLTLFFSLGGCGGDSDPYEEPSTSMESFASETDGQTALYAFAGWWYRPTDDVSVGAIFDFFYVDADLAEWTIYDQYGTAQYTNSCVADESSLTLYMEAPFVDIIFAFDGENLVNDAGGVEFVPGEPMEPVPMPSYDGKWYRGGKTDDYYYVFEGSEYKLFPNFSADDKPIETGTWSLGIQTTQNGDLLVEEPALHLESPQSFSGRTVFVLAEDELVLLDERDEKFYVKESAIGTPEGEDAIARMNLICYDWKLEGTVPLLDFSYFGTFDFVDAEVNQPSVITPGGEWSVENGELSLRFVDGTEEAVSYSRESITVEYYGMTFERFSFWGD